MNNKNYYKEIIRTKIKQVYKSNSDILKDYPHNGSKGTILELMIDDILRPLLPADIGIGTGEIIEFYDKKISKQQDIILYDQSILPPIIIGNSNKGLFPIESVLYTIEVKTCLTREELRKTHLAAKDLYDFRYINDDQNKQTKVRSVLLALSSDLSENGISEIDRYKNLYMAENDEPYVSAICVIGRNYWYRSQNLWLSYKPLEKFDEVLGFIAGICNSYKGISESRGSPKLGYYLIDYPSGIYADYLPIGNENTILSKCNLCGEKVVKMIPESTEEILLLETEDIPGNNKCKCGGVLQLESGKYRNSKGNYIKEIP